MKQTYIPTEDFVEFGSFKQIVGMRPRISGNLLKSKQVTQTVKSIQVSSEDEDQPTIIVRRSQDVVDSIEFSCRCGRIAEVSLKYD